MTGHAALRGENLLPPVFSLYLGGLPTGLYNIDQKQIHFSERLLAAEKYLTPGGSGLSFFSFENKGPGRLASHALYYSFDFNDRSTHRLKVSVSVARVTDLEQRTSKSPYF